MSKSIDGSVTARAMSGFDARWMTMSFPSMPGRQVLEIADVPSHHPQAMITSDVRDATPRPEEKLSKTVTRLVRSAGPETNRRNGFR